MYRWRGEPLTITDCQTTTTQQRQIVCLEISALSGKVFQTRLYIRYS